MERVHETIDSGPIIRPCKRVPPFSLLLWVLFGASGWWSANVMFSELPLFVVELPAAEKLGNQLALMTQMGNIFLIGYKIMQKYFQFDTGTVIQASMFAGVVSLTLCSLTWDTLVHGRSIPLLMLMGITGGIGCLSNSTYWPFMISYPAVCTKACGVGMSLGGVFTTWLAAAQLGDRPASAPRFSARAYFLTAAVLQCCLWLVVLLIEGRLEGCLSCIGLQSNSSNDMSVGLFRMTSEPLENHAQSRALLAVLFCCAFLVQAMTYTLPSLMPYVASACEESDSEQQILLWMLVSQQVGETAGRLLAPVGRAKFLLPAIGAVYFFFVFFIFFALAMRPTALGHFISCDWAPPVLAAMSFGFYCSFGVMQTFIFLCARRLARDKEHKEVLASDIGFFGQMGSLTANVLAFGALNMT